jgi:hypothetical protein
MIGLLTLVLMQGWQPCAPMPTPGYGFACAEVGSRIYAIGGVVSEVYPTVPRLAVEAYDAAADSWIVGFAPLPKPKWYTGCAALDGKIYVIGGWDGQTDLSRVDRFDPSTNTWDTVAPLPWPRWSLAGCAYEGCIYAIGGFSTALGTYQRTVARFTSDSGVGHWDVVESLRTPRTNPAAAVAGGEMCVVGGLFYNALPTWERYQADSWVQSYRLMQFARSGAAAVGWGQWLCAMGGQGLHGPMNSVEMVNVDSGFWLNAAYLSVPRVFCGAAVADGFVVVIGGRDAYGVEGSVEKSDSTLFPSGIEESQSQMQVRAAPRWATVFSGRVRITCNSAAIYDGSGRRVFAGSGPVDVRLAPGVYFARVTGMDDRLVTGTITVVR